MHQPTRRTFFGSLTAVGAASLIAAPAAAQTASPRVINVGPSRPFAHVRAALESITDAGPQRPYLVLIDPGVYTISHGGGPITMKPYVSIAGTDAASVILIGSDANNIRCASNADLRELTVRYSGTAPRGGAIHSDVAGLTDLHLRRLQIEVTGSQGGVVSSRYINRMEMRDIKIHTQGKGIDIRAGGIAYCHDVNIHMFGNTGAPHVGIQANGYCRIWVFGGKIGTGYGYGQVDDPASTVTGVQTEPNFDGRIVMHGVWSICRNGAADDAACVRVTGPRGWVRLFSCYLQAEGFGLAPALVNPAGGRIEVHGTRTRHYGTDTVYSTNQVGLARYTAADHNLQLRQDTGGLILLDASRGAFTLHLPFVPNTTDQYILKKVDNTGRPVTITGNGRSIDGAQSRTLSARYALLHLRFGGDQYYIVA